MSQPDRPFPSGDRTTAPPSSSSRIIPLDLGNLAEVHLVAVNPAHITYVRMTGQKAGDQRRLELHLVGGELVGLNFDEPQLADRVFRGIVAAIDRVLN